MWDIFGGSCGGGYGSLVNCDHNCFVCNADMEMLQQFMNVSRNGVV